MTEIEQLRARCAELEARLAEIGKQEPVAFMYPDKTGPLAGKCFVGGAQPGDIPLYTHAPDSAARIAELEAEKSKAEALLDMWLWETVNQREEHADARKQTQKYFKRAAIDAAALESMIQRAGEVMRERAAKATWKSYPSLDAIQQAGKAAHSLAALAAIRALPAVTLGDLK